MRHIFLLLCLALLPGCCQWHYLKRDMKREYNREVRSAKSLPGDAMSIIRLEMEQVPELIKESKRELRRDMTIHRGILRDIKELECSD